MFQRTLFPAAIVAAMLVAAAAAAEMIETPIEGVPDILLHRSTCNAWVLLDGAAALVVNLGDGSIVGELVARGVTPEWILFTDHHREVCQGMPRVDRTVTKVATPAAERDLFERPLAFRPWRPSLGDAHTVHGASYVRPPAEPIPLDRALDDGEVFTWRSYEIRCIATPGTSPGGMSYVIQRHGKRIALTGALVHDGARMTNWFDTEWDYGFGKGLDALIASVATLRAAELDVALPSHGPAIHDARAQLARYQDRLVAFRPDYLRGYPVDDLVKRRRVDGTVTPTPIPQIVCVTPRLYKFADTLAGKNFAIIIADSGRGLLLDCGLFPTTLLDELVEAMQTHLGLTTIDALWINHMHGDHFTLGSHLKARHGTKIWTLDRIVGPVENPLAYDYCALITSYDPAYTGLRVDRPLRDGEVVRWEGLDLHVDWMPGQTEFGNCLWLELDGKKIAFTGDNLFADPTDPDQNGHEAVVARNSAIFEEGYMQGSRYLLDLAPDIVMGAHNVLMTEPHALLVRYRDWSERIAARYRELLPDPDYEYDFDPFWVSAFPYRVDLPAGQWREVTVTVRNFRDRPQRHVIRLRLPDGVTAEPEVLEGTVEPESRGRFTVRLRAEGAAPGVRMIPFDITLDDDHHGELFDFLVRIHAPGEAAP
ncbi:MAG: MBL fold metallo-hydrolase [Planctomycetota bacterium]|nr:MBL fold metallo-hydrolase [Planctomycetota bacterium]